MIDAFEKESKLHERRAARQRQMRLMEEAASGVPSSLSSPNANARADNVLDSSSLAIDDLESSLGLGGPPTLTDITSSNNNNNYSIDDDDDTEDEDAGPPSVFTNASQHLWKSQTTNTLSMDAEKLGFITGGMESDSSSATPKTTGNWMRGNRKKKSSKKNKGVHKENDESRELILMASRRLAGGTSTNMNSFNIDSNSNNNGEEGDDFRSSHDNKSTRYVKLPVCCMVHRRAICATGMILTLFIVLLAVTEPMRRNKNSSGNGGNASPWAGYTPVPLPEYDMSKFNRIKDRILEHEISHAYSLEETYTPQYKALLWLVRDDPRQLDLPNVDDEGYPLTGTDIDVEQTLFERYALATLWYQTNDLLIVQQSMTGSDVEDPFDMPFNPLDLTKEDIQWNKNTNWMSEKGICLWFGVTCHPHDTYGEKYDGDFYVAILNLTSNNVNGIVPREVYTGFNRLKALDLSKNELEGTIGRELGLLTDLEDLFIFENNFSGVLPDDIGKLQNLYNLYINDNKFHGTIPNAMGNLIKLRGASMFNNTFGGRIPDTFDNLQEMIALYLDENELTGPIPPSLGRMSSMIDLRLRDNKLSGTIPTSLGDLSNLETLYLDTNPNIEGTIPSELSKLDKLNELHLYQMDLSGPLPPELGILEGLVFLYLDTNELTGTIPDEWGQMRDLEELFLTDNNLNGRLPITLRGMTSLHTLRAAENELSGPIPSDMGKMLKLEYVYLEGNNFSGQVPSELGQLTKLKLMHLHDSKLSGEMPASICKLKEGFLLRDLTVDCEELTCTCCTCT